MSDNTRRQSLGSVVCWRSGSTWSETSKKYVAQLFDGVGLFVGLTFVLHKGDTVIVIGRLKMREYDDANGGPRRTFYEVDAQAVGPDLSRYVALLARPNRDLTDVQVPEQQGEEPEIAAATAA